MVRLDKFRNRLEIIINDTAQSPAETLAYFQRSLIAVLRRAILHTQEADLFKEEIEAVVDVLDLLNHTLPDEKQLHKLELSQPELLLELEENLSKLEKERIADLKEIKRLKAELENDQPED